MMEAAEGSRKSCFMEKPGIEPATPGLYGKKTFPDSCCLSYFYKYSDSSLSENKDVSIRIKFVLIIHATFAKYM